MLKHFDNLIQQVENLENTELQIQAIGNYPTKYQTLVQDVAHYQNDGTEGKDGRRGVTPSRFVERAAEANREWTDELEKALDEFFDGNKWELSHLGEKIALDITAKIDRIKTGRLKRSLREKIIER